MTVYRELIFSNYKCYLMYSDYEKNYDKRLRHSVRIKLITIVIVS